MKNESWIRLRIDSEYVVPHALLCQITDLLSPLPCYIRSEFLERGSFSQQLINNMHLIGLFEYVGNNGWQATELGKGSHLEKREGQWFIEIPLELVEITYDEWKLHIYDCL